MVEARLVNMIKLNQNKLLSLLTDLAKYEIISILENYVQTIFK
jgi:hypothetical protein